MCCGLSVGAGRLTGAVGGDLAAEGALRSSLAGGTFTGDVCVRGAVDEDLEGVPTIDCLFEAVVRGGLAGT